MFQTGLHLWEAASPVVVLGRSGSAAREVNLEACRADGVPVLHRTSGGGAVVLAPGCLNYCLTLSLDRYPEMRDVRASYQRILSSLIRALDVPGLEIRGLSDLAVDGRKVSGNSQRRDAHTLLHHGTLLYRFDAHLAERYLVTPPRSPEYRAARRHADFLGNLPLTGSELRARLAAFHLLPMAKRCCLPRT